jgi:hypothetical protein
MTKNELMSQNKFLVHLSTLESGIDVGQGIIVGPGKLDKNNKRREWKI